LTIFADVVFVIRALCSALAAARELFASAFVAAAFRFALPGLWIRAFELSAGAVAVAFIGGRWRSGMRVVAIEAAANTFEAALMFELGMFTAVEAFLTFNMA